MNTVYTSWGDGVTSTVMPIDLSKVKPEDLIDVGDPKPPDVLRDPVLAAIAAMPEARDHYHYRSADELTVPLVRDPDFHPRRRLQIRGAIAAASMIAGDLAAATSRVAQMIKDTASKQRPHKAASKKRRKDRKRQRQARRKNR